MFASGCVIGPAVCFDEDDSVGRSGLTDGGKGNDGAGVSSIGCDLDGGTWNWKNDGVDVCGAGEEVLFGSTRGYRLARLSLLIHKATTYNQKFVAWLVVGEAQMAAKVAKCL